MPIIKNKTKTMKAALRIRIDEDIYREMQKYMEWANIKHKDFFFEEICQYVFDQDKKWTEFKKVNYKDGFRRTDDSMLDIENMMVADDEGMPNLSDTENLGEKLKKENT
jgi:hypothetical protein